MFDGEINDPNVLPAILFAAPALRAGPGERLITLTGDYEALIDEDDYPLLRGRAFYAHKSRSNTYARNRCLGYLHQIICGAQPGWVVDHLNRNSLDCRRNNLRIAGYDANAQNASYTNSTTGFRGVALSGARYRATITVAGERRHLGMFPTPEDAARAYDHAAMTVYGPFAWTNFARDLRSAGRFEAPPF